MDRWLFSVAKTIKGLRSAWVDHNLSRSQFEVFLDEALTEACIPFDSVKVKRNPGGDWFVEVRPESFTGVVRNNLVAEIK